MKYSIFLSVLIVFLFVSCKHEQSNTIELTTQYDERINNSITPADSIVPKTELKNFKGIEKFRLKYFRVLEFTVNYEQQVYLDYFQKKISKSAFKKIFKVNRYDLNDTVTLSNKYLKNNISILSGVDQNNQRLIVTDANNDDDFSDDIAYRYDKLQQQKIIDSDNDYTQRFPLTTIHFEKFLNGKVQPAYALVKVLPYKNFYDSYTDSIQKSLEVVVQDSKYKSGNLNLGDKNYTFYSIKIRHKFDLSDKEDDTELKLVLSDSLKKNDQTNWYTFENIIPIDNVQYLKFHIVNNNTVSYDEHNLKETPGINIGQPFPLHTFYNYKTARPESFAFKSGDYTLVDFWGTWCGPCVAEMPHMNLLYRKFADKKHIKFVGIAYDDKSKIIAMDSILRSNHIEYKNLIDDKAMGGQSFEKKYHVETYPTLILIDKTGFVIFKTNDIERDNQKLSSLLARLN